MPVLLSVGTEDLIEGDGATMATGHDELPVHTDSHYSARRTIPLVREGLAAIIGSQKTDMALGYRTGGECRRGNRGIASSSSRRHTHRSATAGHGRNDTLIAIRGAFPNARIIMLSMSDGDGEIQRALRSGASAYMLKSMPKDKLLSACIRSVHAGRRSCPRKFAARLAEHLGEDSMPANWRCCG